MTAGRTTWYPNDAAEHDRELIVELGDEFGPIGQLVLRVMKDLAAQQSLRTGGHVRTGFRVLSKKCTIQGPASEAIDLTRRIVTRAAEIGALDDLEIDEDGRRFTCRVSGWDADFRRGKETLKKGDQRTKDQDDEDQGMSSDGGDMSPSEGDMSPKIPSTEQDRTEDSSLRSEDARPRAVRFARRTVPEPTVALAVAVVERFNERAGTAYRPFGDDGRPSENLKRVLGALLRDQRITLPVADEMIRAVLGGRRFWDPSRPHLGHVFGERMVEAVLEGALRAATPTGGLSAGDRIAIASRQRNAEAELGETAEAA